MNSLVPTKPSFHRLICINESNYMKRSKKILYVSCLCSPRVIEYLFDTSVRKPLLSIQKFHRLLVEGFAVSGSLCRVQTLGAIPVTYSSHKKRIWNLPSEVIGNIKYTYVPMVNMPILKNIGVFIYSFFKVLFSTLFGCRKDKVVVCDVLNLSITAGALLASKLTRTKSVAIVTDMPDLMVANSQRNSLNRNLFNNLASSLMSLYDGYILLTEQMNERVNVHHKPYIVMEGLVDKNMVTIHNVFENKSSERILIYAGGIYEKYGIKKLIEAFMRLDADDVQLHIYGPGEMAADMPKYMKADQRIVYHGMVPNNEVVDKELEATLLINPRPSTEELTKYSFPSKNMEYMVSGTPLLTTPLPGMPEEYKRYAYLFDDESTDGIYETLKLLLSKSKEELHEFGNRAKQFVLTNKSNIVQAKRVLSFFEII